MDLVFGVQALRRTVDRDARALCGALGVAARHLPHQLGNTRRLLAAPRIRHLLADEVGMGKTIQALMLLNALRLQRPTLRALIIVPNALTQQWRDEHLTRGHHSPIEEEPERDSSRRVRLAWPQVLRSSDINPDCYDILIVDEFHSLTAGLQQRILEVASRFTHLLLISATPPFQDSERLDELFRMLEPERAELLTTSGASLSEHLLERERRVAALLETDDIDDWRALGGAPPRASSEAAAEAHCWLRRVIRTRRHAFQEHMPRREHRPLIIEPVEAEVQRQRLMWRYFGHLGDLSRDFNLDLLAQRVIRSPTSLRQRVTYLRGHGHEREGILEQVSKWLPTQLGDSRLDALCDLLAGIWREDPAAKILVAAGDNLTVDDLSRRLPEILDQIGPPGARRELSLTRIRNQTQGADSLADPEDQIARAVSDFSTGTASLLLAADVGKLGLNLQVTRHIVLYSIPWDPQEIEQWIGRIDRIGNAATLSDEGRLLPILVHTICQRGLVDERLVEVMKQTAVLERSLSLDSSAVATVREAIRAAALAGAAGSWVALNDAARDLQQVSMAELESPLLAHLPWGAGAAKALLRSLEEAEPLPPSLSAPDRGVGLRGREESLLGWLRALKRAGEYDLRGPSRAKQRPRSIGLRVDDARGGLLSRVPLSDELAPYRSRPVYFHASRSELSQPPQREYMWRRSPTPVYFLDHGSPLHEELVGAWLRQGELGEEQLRMWLPEAHPACTQLRDQVVSLWIGDLDPAALLGSVTDHLEPIFTSHSHLIMRLASSPDLIAARDADERFLRLHLPRQLILAGEILSPSTNKPLSEEDVAALLDPWRSNDAEVIQSVPWSHGVAWLRGSVDQSWERLQARGAQRARQRWSPYLPSLQEAVESRCYVLTVEGGERSRVYESRLRQLSRDISSATSRGQQTLKSRQREETAAELTLHELSLELRLGWLRGSCRRLDQITPQQYRRALIKIET